MRKLGLLAGFTALLLFALPAEAQSPCSSPQLEISSPTAGALLSGSVEIRGSACLGADFNFYKFEYLPPGGVSGWVWVFNGRQEVVNGLLGVWDTRPGSDTFGDGTYTIRLTIVHRDGNFQETPLRQVILANREAVATATPTPEGSPTPEGTAGEATPTPIIIAQPTVVEIQPTPFPGVVVTPAPSNGRDDGSGLVALPDLGSLGVACLSGGIAALLGFGLTGFLVIWKRGSGSP